MGFPVVKKRGHLPLMKGMDGWLGGWGMRLTKIGGRVDLRGCVMICIVLYIQAKLNISGP
jgi:hypothetical protein